MFSKVDIFSLDKQLELNERLKLMENKLHVIALQEVKPKNFRFEKSAQEYNLEGYVIVEHNLWADFGGGLLLYARDGISYYNVLLDTNYCEH